MKKVGCAYIMTNQNRNVLYTSVTSNIKQRIMQHKRKCFPNAFTRKYNIGILVYYEISDSMVEAVKREKQIKKPTSKKEN